MMSTENMTPEEASRENPFRTDAAPARNVSGIPEDYVVIDLSHETHEQDKSEAAPTEPVPAPKEEAAEPAVVTESSAEETAAESAETPAEALAEPAVTVVTMEILGVRFKKGGKIYYFDPHGIKGKKGDAVIVETARGQEYGEIALENTRVPESEIVPPIRSVIRIATEADTVHFEENRKKENEAFSICLQKIEAHKLDMKLVEAQYTFDNSKLLFYFTSAGRVDFRDLVKDLASVFRTRIELRQIGIRDEAKLIGGLGSCGRALCCAGFLSDFGQVSIKMAKEQNLSLNSTKISGTCGRLMCCLRYEYETYLEEIRLTPPTDSVVKTPDGVGTVVETAPLLGTVKVRLLSEPDAPPRSYHRDTVTVYANGKAPTEEDLAVRAKPKDDLAFADRLAAFESTKDAQEIPARRPETDPTARRERSDPPGFRKKEDARGTSRPQRRNPEGGNRPRGEENGARPNPPHRQSRPKNPNHPSPNHRGKPGPAQKTQHKGAGGKNGSGSGNS